MNELQRKLSPLLKSSYHLVTLHFCRFVVYLSFYFEFKIQKIQNVCLKKYFTYSS